MLSNALLQDLQIRTILASLSEALAPSAGSPDLDSNEFELGVINAGHSIQFVPSHGRQKRPRSTYFNKPIQFLGGNLTMVLTIDA